MLNFQQKEKILEKYLKILKKCPLFAEIEEENLLRMLSCLGAKVVSFDKKYTVFAEGSPAKYIGIMLSGSAQIIQVDYYGNRSILSEVSAPESAFPLMRSIITLSICSRCSRSRGERFSIFCLPTASSKGVSA